MARALNETALDGLAKYMAAQYMLPDRQSRNKTRYIGGASYVMQDLYALHYKDEFEKVKAGIMARLGGEELKDFEKRASGIFTPRDDKVYVDLLKRQLAVDPNGNHVEGAIGTVIVGRRPIRIAEVEVEAPWSIMRRKWLIRENRELKLKIHDPLRTDRETIMRKRLVTWPVYAGEAAERDAGNIGPIGEGGADELPEDAFATLNNGMLPPPLGANVTNISAESAINGVDGVAGSVDEGSTAAAILLYDDTGTTPVDPDAGPNTNVLLGTMVCSDPAFTGAVDDTDGSVSSPLDSVTDDSSADATGTADFAFVNATGTGADLHIQLNAGVSDEAFLMNTVAVAAGATISVTSGSVGMSQGTTAT